MVGFHGESSAQSDYDWNRACDFESIQRLFCHAQLYWFHFQRGWLEFVTERRCYYCGGDSNYWHLHGFNICGSRWTKGEPFSFRLILKQNFYSNFFSFSNLVFVCRVIDRHGTRSNHIGSVHDAENMAVWCWSIQLGSDSELFIYNIHCIVGNCISAIHADRRIDARKCQRFQFCILYSADVLLHFHRNQIFTTFNRTDWLPWDDVCVRCRLFVLRTLPTFMYAGNKRQKPRTNYGVAEIKGSKSNGLQCWIHWI